MNRSLLWRGAIIVAVVVLAVFAAHPLAEKLKLGLDLRGGIHLVLQVEVEDAARSETAKDMDRLLDSGVSQLVRRPVSDATLDASTGHPH